MSDLVTIGNAQPTADALYVGARRLPRFRLRQRPRSSHAPVALDWMVDQLRAQSQTPPGAVHGVQFVELDSDDQTFDGLGGTLISYRPSAAMFEYSIDWLPTGVGGKYGWMFEYSHAALQWMEVDRIALTNDIQTLQEELAKSGITPAEKKAKEDELEEASQTLALLQNGQNGYAETVPQCLNSGVSGVFWKLQAPNVPIKATSTFTLPKGRAFSVRLKRLKPTKEQARYAYSITIANDKGAASTAYMLRLGNDGNASEFFHFRNMKPSRRKALFAAWDALEGAKFLTPAERKQTLDWEEQEQTIRAAAKGRGLSVEDSREIDALKEKAKKLKSDKKLTAEEEEDKQLLERELFIEKRQFKLQESANELLGKTIEITFHFLRAGYIVIQSSETRFVYENKRITGLVPPQYADGLPDGCRLQIDSDGGMWRLCYGHPRYERRALLLSQPFSIPFPFALDEVLSGFDGDDSAPDCAISVLLRKVVYKTTPPSTGSAVHVSKPARYQLAIEMTGNGEYSPELYSAGFHLPAAVVSEESEVVYDSQNPGFPQGVAGNWIRDVILQAGAGRSPECTVYLGLKNDETVDPPLNVAPLIGEVVFHNPQTATDTTAIRFARVAAVPLNELRGLDTDEDKFAPRVVRGSEARYSLVGPLEWLNREVEAAFVMARYEYGNDVLRALFQDAELPLSLYSRIKSGDIGISKIPPTQPGRYPETKIAANARLIEVAQDVVRRFCPGWQLVQDGLGFDLVKQGQRDRPELSYDLPPVVSPRSPLCLRHEFHLEQDLSDICTGVTVYGARDPLTGVRYSHTETLPKMFDQRFEHSSYFVGFERHKTLEPDPTLTSVTACVRRAREELHITPLTPDGLTPWTGNAVMDVNATLRCGDLLRVFDVKFLIEDIDLGNLAAGEDAGKVRLKLRLAEDRLLQRGSIN